jgi:hypothetical protein
LKFSHSQASLFGWVLVVGLIHAALEEVRWGRDVILLPVAWPAFGELADLVALEGKVVGAVVANRTLGAGVWREGVEVWHCCGRWSYKLDGRGS